MMLTANRASRRGAPCERRSSAVSPAFHASSQQARSLRPSLRPLAEPPSTAGQSDGLSRHTMTPRGLANTASPSAATEVCSTMIRAGTKSWSAAESGGIGGGTAPSSAA